MKLVKPNCAKSTYYLSGLIALVTILVLFGTTSCKKKSADPEPESEPVPEAVNQIPEPPKALVIDSNSTKVKFTFSIPSWTNSGLEFRLNLDLDGDQFPDIHFFRLNAHGGFGLYMSSVTVQSLNNSTWISCDSIYNMSVEGGTIMYTPHVVNELTAKPYQFNDTIKELEKWRSGPATIFNYSDEWVHTDSIPNHKEWQYSDIGFENKPLMCIAVKVKNKLGWLKVSQYLYTNLFVYSFALVK